MICQYFSFALACLCLSCSFWPCQCPPETSFLCPLQFLLWSAGTRWWHRGKYPPRSLNCTLRVGDPAFCDPCGSDCSVMSCNCVPLERTGLHYFLHYCTVQERTCEFKRKQKTSMKLEKKTKLQ